MKRVITAAILVPLVLLLILKGSYLLIVAATALVAELAAWEYLSLADAAGARTPRGLVLAGIAVLFAAAYRDPGLEGPAFGLSSMVLLVVCAFRSPAERVLPDTAFSVFGLVYPGLALTTIPLIEAQPDGSFLLLLLFAVVWSGDIAGFYIGRGFGRTKLAPRISPKKTWEGSAASMAASLLAAALVVYLGGGYLGGGYLDRGHLGQRPANGSIHLLAYGAALPRWLALAALLNLAAQVGDLAESAIKRGAGVKDSGGILPGHGGLLDRIDALLLAAPVFWCALWLQHNS